MSGYLHPGYAASLAEFGTPCLLPRCGGWLLRRPIPNEPLHDARACYPLFTCQDWSHLARDLEELGREVVTVTAVTDPFGSLDERTLSDAFPQLVRTYKSHYVVELGNDPCRVVSKHHRRNARLALTRLSVEVCANPSSHLEEWLTLYANLVRRHAITGIAAFSRTSFAGQLEVPGLRMFRATHEADVVGMNLWFVQDDRAYYHLGAYSEAGYTLGASFGIFWTAIQHFSESGLCWLGLGAGAGIRGDSMDGLSRFKRGWATGTRTVYLCGRICNPDQYHKLIGFNSTAPAPFFPAYRRAEDLEQDVPTAETSR